MSHKRAEDAKQGATAAEDTGDNGVEAQRMLYVTVMHFSLALQRPKLEHTGAKEWERQPRENERWGEERQ